MKSKTRLIFLSGILFIFLGLIIYRPLKLNLDWSIDLRDWLHWAGIVAFTIFSITSIIALKTFRISVSDWLNIHCVGSTFSLALALIHSRTKGGVILPVHYHSYFTLLLIVVLTISGIMIRFYPNLVNLRKYWLLFHLPLSVGFYITLFYHILVKLGVI